MSKLLWILQIVVMVALWPLQARAEPQTAQDVVVSTTDQVLKTLRDESGGKDTQTTLGAIDHLVIPHIDLAKMSQRLLGKQWLSATAEQKDRFSGELRKLLVKTYASVFLQYANAKIAYLPGLTDPSGNIAIVKSRVTNESASPVNIDYQLRQQNGEWKLIDVAVGGVSLVANYRASFGKLVGSKGIDGLTTALSAHNQS